MKAIESSLQYCWLDVLAANAIYTGLCLLGCSIRPLFYLCFLLVVLMPVGSNV